MTDHALRAPAPGRRRTPAPKVGAATATTRVGLRARIRAAWASTATARARAARMAAVVSPLGWLLLGTMLVAGWAGRTYNWQELWLLAVAAGVLLLMASVFVLGRNAYRVEVDLASRRVVVGTRATGRIVVANAGSRTQLGSRIELPVGQGVAAFRVPRLGKGAEHEDLFVVPTSRRGVVPVGPVLSVRDDPVRLLRREVRWTEVTELFIHPRTVVLAGSSAGFLRDLEGLPTRDLSSSDVSFHALRDYAPGDDRRSVHWRTTARTGKLMVRQYEEIRRSHLVVALSVRADDYAEADEFELAISCAASLALQAIREEKLVTVLTQHGTLTTATGQRFLDATCRLELVEDVPDLVSLARVATSEVPGASAVAILGGSPVHPRTWQRASTYVPLGALGFGLAPQVGASVTRRSIGSFPIVGLGELGELPRVMRRLEVL